MVINLANEYLLVDGYNIIYAWEELRNLAEGSLDAARLALQDILCNYQGYKKICVIVVYDGYRVKGNPGSVSQYFNIDIVFTKEAETADAYIEKTSHELLKDSKVTVATSDMLEQMIILGQGASRLSAGDLKMEIDIVNQLIKDKHLDKPVKRQNLLFDHASPELAELLEEMRLKGDN